MFFPGGHCFLEAPALCPGWRGAVVVESLAFIQNACLPYGGHTKVAKNPLGDGDRKPGFQGDAEAAWGKKSSEAEEEAGILPRRPVPSQPPWARGSWSPLLSPRVYVSHKGLTLKRQEGPWWAKTGCQAFRGKLKKPKEKSGEAMELARFLPRGPLPSQQALRLER